MGPGGYVHQIGGQNDSGNGNAHGCLLVLEKLGVNQVYWKGNLPQRSQGSLPEPTNCIRASSRRLVGQGTSYGELLVHRNSGDTEAQAGIAVSGHAGVAARRPADPRWDAPASTAKHASGA